MVAKVIKYFMVLYTVFMITPTTSGAQEVDAEGYAVTVDEIPSPIGGLKAVQERVVYPKFAKKFWIEGDVFLEACVDTDGTVTNIKIVKGIEYLNQAASNALRETKFSPALLDKKPVKSRVILRVTFRMEN